MAGAVFVILLSAFQLFSISAFAPITLAWDASSGTNVIANYKVYYGVATATYTNSVSAGTNLTAFVSNLVLGATYYFAATAVDTSGLESDYSSEVSWNPGSARTNLALTITTTGIDILFARTVCGPWTATNAACITLINPIPPIFFRSRGPTCNQVAIAAAPY
jgi:hypothetical protein